MDLNQIKARHNLTKKQAETYARLPKNKRNTYLGVIHQAQNLTRNQRNGFTVEQNISHISRALYGSNKFITNLRNQSLSSSKKAKYLNPNAGVAGGKLVGATKIRQLQNAQIKAAKEAIRNTDLAPWTKSLYVYQQEYTAKSLAHASPVALTNRFQTEDTKNQARNLVDKQHSLGSPLDMSDDDILKYAGTYSGQGQPIGLQIKADKAYIVRFADGDDIVAFQKLYTDSKGGQYYSSPFGTYWHGEVIEDWQV